MFVDSRTPLYVFVLGTCALLGLVYFTLQARAAQSRALVVPWYTLAVVPWMTALFQQGARLLPGKWAATALPLALLAVYVATEIYGSLFVMIPYYTGHAD